MLYLMMVYLLNLSNKSFNVTNCEFEQSHQITAEMTQFGTRQRNVQELGLYEVYNF